jgi:transcriptional regulator with XRE-family HTH domain
MNNKIVKNFSYKLKKLRQDKKLTQEQLAEKADISYRSLQDLEARHPSSPNLKTLHKLAAALEMPLSKLVEDL